MSTSKKALSMISILSLISLLSSCELAYELSNTTKVNPPEYQDKINKNNRFKNTYFLCEVQDWRQSLSASRQIYLSTSQGYCGRLLKRTPSISEYLQNPQSFATWHRDMDIQYRIIGMVNPGELYRLDKAVTRAESTYLDFTIMSGRFAGIHVMGSAID